MWDRDWSQFLFRLWDRNWSRFFLRLLLVFGLFVLAVLCLDVAAASGRLPLDAVPATIWSILIPTAFGLRWALRALLPLGLRRALRAVLPLGLRRALRVVKRALRALLPPSRPPPPDSGQSA